MKFKDGAKVRPLLQPVRNNQNPDLNGMIFAPFAVVDADKPTGELAPTTIKDTPLMGRKYYSNGVYAVDFLIHSLYFNIIETYKSGDRCMCRCETAFSDFNILIDQDYLEEFKVTPCVMEYMSAVGSFDDKAVSKREADIIKNSARHKTRYMRDTYFPIEGMIKISSDNPAEDTAVAKSSVSATVI